MNALTHNALTTVGNQVHPQYVYHITTLAYIQTLLQPYAEAIEGALDTKSILDWILLAFPGQLAKHATSEAIKAITAANAKIEDYNGEATPEALAVAKIETIEYLVAEIMELSGAKAMRENAPTVLPWDVQKTLSEDEEFSQMFTIAPNSNTLPVTVTVAEKQFEHQLSEEFTIGLLLFSFASGYDFHITLFGKELDINYLVAIDDRYSKYQTDDLTDKNFSIKIKGEEFAFNTPEFLQGFATGASWLSVDHHEYWSQLLQLDTNPHGERVATTVVF